RASLRAIPRASGQADHSPRRGGRGGAHPRCRKSANRYRRADRDVGRAREVPRLSAGANGYNVTFSDFIRSLGFEPPSRIEPGRWLPFSTNGKPGDTAGRAKLFPDGEGGIVHDWRSGESWAWQAQREGPRSAVEVQAWREKCERAKREA